MSLCSLVLPVLLVLLCGSSRAYYDRQVQRIADLDNDVDGAEAYLLPPLPPKYPPHGNWEPAPEPRLYVLTDDSLEQDQAARRVKRQHGKGPSLSIVNSLDVLRQRLLLEMARRRSESQINANRQILDGIGKREISQSELDLESTRANSVGNSRSHQTSDTDLGAKSRVQRQHL